MHLRGWARKAGDCSIAQGTAGLPKEAAPVLQPGCIVLRALQDFLDPPNGLRRWLYYYPDITEEETRQRG